jgi:hypothetical protein
MKKSIIWYLSKYNYLYRFLWYIRLTNSILNVYPKINQPFSNFHISNFYDIILRFNFLFVDNKNKNISSRNIIMITIRK